MSTNLVTQFPSPLTVGANGDFIYLVRASGVVDGRMTRSEFLKGITAIAPNGGTFSVNPVAGYQIYKADGTTAISVLSVNDSNNMHIDPNRGTTFVAVGPAGSRGNPALLLHNNGVPGGCCFYIESFDYSQDMPTISTDASDNLLFGNATAAGGSHMNNTYFQVQTGKSFFWSFNAVNKLTMTATSWDIYGGAGSAGVTINGSAGSLASAGTLASLGGRCSLDAGGDSGIKKIATGVTGFMVGNEVGGWAQNTPGRRRMASDLPNATATMANLTDLSTSVLAGRKYAGILTIKCDDTTAAEGIKFDFDGGGSTWTSFIAAASVFTGGTSVAGVTVSAAIATDLTFTTITNETWIVIRWSGVVNAAGTFIPRFAQVAHTTGTATVYTNSTQVIEDIP